MSTDRTSTLLHRLLADELDRLQSRLDAVERRANVAEARNNLFEVRIDNANALAAASEAARERLIEEAAKVADTDDELPGPMPSELHLVPLEDALRAAVRATKKSIAQRIRALASPPAQPPASEAVDPDTAACQAAFASRYYAAPAPARDAVLEEAAKIAEQMDFNGLAAALRSLIKPTILDGDPPK